MLPFLIALLVVPVPQAAQSAPPLAIPPRSAGVAQVQSRDGAWSERPVAGLACDSLGELGAIALRFATGAAVERAAADRAQVRLGPDEWVDARVASASGERLELELPGGARLAVAIDDLLSVVFPARIEGSGRATPPASGDRLYWVRPRGLDRVDGSFQEFSGEGVVFESALGVRTFPWAEVGALLIEPLGAPSPQPRGPRSVGVDLSQGGRLNGELVRIHEGVLTLRWRGGAELALGLDGLSQIVLDDGSVSHLSTRTPVSVAEGWPPGDDSGMRWPYQVDRSVMGGPLRAGGRVWARGLGVHSPSRLEWELDGGWKTLLGAVAIDDSVELLAYPGSVRCAIYLDGAEQPAWRSGRIEGGAAPTPIGALDLSGVRRIALEVEMDERLYVADRLNWLDLRLVK